MAHSSNTGFTISDETSLTMASVDGSLQNDNDDHLELFSLLWLNDNANIEHNQDAKRKLRSAINHFKEFQDVKQCREYVEYESKKEKDRLILVAKNDLGQEIVPRIHKFRQIVSIYIFGKSENKDMQWMKQFAKVKAVVVEVDELVSRIKTDLKTQMKEEELSSMYTFTTGKSATEINGRFVFSQVFIDCLLRLRPSDVDVEELISRLKREYQENNAELSKLNEFEKDYTPNKVFWWYTRDSFFYKILNAALRKQDIRMILLYRTFISHIHRQLKVLQCKDPVRVYRSQLMSIDELEFLQQYVGQFISMNSFLSTSRERPVALFYMGDTTQKIDLERVLFEIEASPDTARTKPFADISAYSCFDTEWEVLFMLGSIFRLNSVMRGEDQVWIIRMTLCSDDEHVLKEVVVDMKNRNGIGETNFHTLGKLLSNMGEWDLAEKYYTRLIKELSSNDPLLCVLFEELSQIASQKQDFDKWAQLRQKLLELKRQLPSTEIINTGLPSEPSIDIDPVTTRELIYRTVETIKETVEQVKANKNQCKRLAQRIDTITSVLQRINDPDLQRWERRKFLMNFCICIEQCLAFISKFQDDHLWFLKVFNSVNSKEQFKKLNSQLMQCTSDLNLGIDLEQIFDPKEDQLDRQNDLYAIQHKLDEIASMMVEQQQEQQLGYLRHVKDDKKRRHNSYRYHLEENISHANDAVKVAAAKTSIGHEHSFLRIPYYDLVQEELTGQGGFADVYRGRWLSQDREVAIKIIRIHYLGEKVKTDFIKEISVMQQIHYEHILTMYGACIEPEKYALVVEYMSLGSLYDVLKEQTIELTWSDRWLIALQITKGINYLHTLPKPIIHRDIKSHNVLMTKYNQNFLVKIGDFGLAKIRHETSRQSVTGPVVGTLAWKAPELLRMGKHTEASDVYALGIVFWELATGCEPYGDADASTISAFVQRGDRLEISEDIPTSFAELITVAWAQEPKQRPTCQRLLQLLKERHAEDNVSDPQRPTFFEDEQLSMIENDNTDNEILLINSTQLTTDTSAEYEMTTRTRISRFSDVSEEPNVLLMPITGYEKTPLISLEIAVESLVTFLPNIQRFAYVAKQRCTKPNDDLSVDESAAIMLYSMSWEPFVECLYYKLNETLRSKDRRSLTAWFPYLKLLFTALSHLPSLTRTVYRGIKLDLSAEYVPGKTVVWWGFSSCTSKIDVLQSDNFLGNTGCRTIFAIDCYSGKDIRQHSYYSNEDEILLSAGTEFEVIGRLNQGHGLVMIQLKEVLSSSPQNQLAVILGSEHHPRPTGPHAFHSGLSDNSSLGPPDQYIFLSYENADKPLVDRIADILTDEGGNVWTDDMIDDHEETNTADAIEKAWVFICFPTDAYQNSEACRDEVCSAKRCGKKILPIMTKANWQPTSWLAHIIGSKPFLKWENIEPDDVAFVMSDLIQRLKDLCTGNLSRTRQRTTRNSTLETRPQANRTREGSDVTSERTRSTRR